MKFDNPLTDVLQLTVGGTLSADLIVGGSGAIESSNYVAGSVGWHIDPALAEFSNVIVRGAVIVGAGSSVPPEYFTDGTSSADIIVDGSGSIESSNYVAGSVGWHIDPALAEFSNVIVRGTIYASAGELGDLDITGTLSIAAGGIIEGPVADGVINVRISSGQFQLRTQWDDGPSPRTVVGYIDYQEVIHSTMTSEYSGAVEISGFSGVASDEFAQLRVAGANSTYGLRDGVLITATDTPIGSYFAVNSAASDRIFSVTSSGTVHGLGYRAVYQNPTSGDVTWDWEDNYWRARFGGTSVAQGLRIDDYDTIRIVLGRDGNQRNASRLKVGGSSASTYLPWAAASIDFGATAVVGTQGSYNMDIAWNWTRTASGYAQLGVNSYSSAATVQLGHGGIKFQYDSNMTSAGVPRTVAGLFAQGFYINGVDPYTAQAAWLFVDSPSTGGNYDDQEAGVSIGESPASSTAVHIVYTGDGYGHIGMGVVTKGNAKPMAYRAFKMKYNTNYLHLNLVEAYADTYYHASAYGSLRITTKTGGRITQNSYSSSRKYKRNIRDLTPETSPFRNYRPRSFRFKDHPDLRFLDGLDKRERRYGLIMEEAVADGLPAGFVEMHPETGKPHGIYYNAFQDQLVADHVALLQDYLLLKERVAALESAA